MGLPPDRCDAIMARMVYHMIEPLSRTYAYEYSKCKPKPNFKPNPDQVYHMIDVAVARDVYLPQISRALGVTAGCSSPTTGRPTRASPRARAPQLVWVRDVG